MTILEAIEKYDLYDTHSHINSEPLLSKLANIINICEQEKTMMNAIGTNEIDSEIAIELANKYDNVFAIIGFHPQEIGNKTPQQCYQDIEQLILSDINHKVVAIGETGLDYVCSDVDHEIQKQVFIKHIELAKRYHLPLNLHIREAHDDAIEILKQYANGITKIVHCYSGNSSIAKRYLELGCYFAINGIATFKKKNEELIQALLTTIPYSNLLLETDCPYLAPEPIRGTENNPANIKYIFARLALIYNINQEEFKMILKNNAKKVFAK